jgi:hypothetical protein
MYMPVGRSHSHEKEEGFVESNSKGVDIKHLSRVPYKRRQTGLYLIGVAFEL